MARSKKAKVLTSVAAVALAASMIIGGGTYAYLQGVSDDVVNTFNANQVTVELEETKGPNYDIIPGTSQEKDPKVTVNNTVDAYVFVEVTDNTDGLVEYAIEDGWTALGDAYPGVYYREVAANAQENEFYVLKDNTVSYDAALTNEDMLENGELKDGLELTFKAYAIQAEPFANAVEAWNGKDSVSAKDAASVVDAIKNNKPVIIEDDITITEDLGVVMADNGVTDANINLNGHSVTLEAQQHIEHGRNITIENGSIYHNADSAATANAFFVNTGASATLEKVDLVVEGKPTASHTPTAIYIINEGSEVNVINSDIKFSEGSSGTLIGTNAGDEANYNVVINIKDSNLDTGMSDGWTSIGVLLNIPGTLNIEGSTIKGEVAAVAVRGGTATIKDSQLSRPYPVSGTDENTYFMDGNWGSGNSFPISTLLLGNRGTTGYQYATDVTLVNTTVSANSGKTVYMYGNTGEGLGATLTYDAACQLGDIVAGNDACTVNGPAA